ncbi:transcriptional regulator, TetR family [Luminiphilus syltensis NOR5-1B]|uniref:Transcriptional regulator, TetR family n=1 Tax=Luminiphilus syltensis NOR5-1B TaxID=565045 RepID=B8KQG2_9GAMM|nr:TetR family transcriptional regulator [Luminiphilus syltensis]EED36707.1 transcriptional regulator, TetR family [Luminiphilus syltensis NOR5-1B]
MKVKAGDKLPRQERNKQAERSALSDRKMLEAAVELVNERGTAKTTLKEIGEAAGYSRGLASYRFGSKDGLWSELFARFDALWRDHLRGYLKDKNGLAAIRAAIHCQKDFFLKEPSYLRAMYILWYESLGRESDIRAELASHHRIYRRDVANWIKEAQAADEIRQEIDPEMFAASYCSHMFGIIYQWVVAPQQIDVASLLDDFERAIIFNLTEGRQQ